MVGVSLFYLVMEVRGLRFEVWVWGYGREEEERSGKESMCAFSVNDDIVFGLMLDRDED